MHILYLTNEYPRIHINHGGIGSFVQTIGKELVKDGHNVTVLGIGSTDNVELNDCGINVISLSKSSWRFASFVDNFLRINKTIKKINNINKIDIIEAPELQLAFIRKIENIKYVIRLHGGHHFFSKFENKGLNIWKSFQEKFSFFKADAYISVTNFTLQETSKYFNLTKKPVCTISNPIDINKFKPITSSKSVDNFQIVFVGTLCKKKGVYELIQAFQIVRSVFPESILYMYGRDWFSLEGESYINFLKGEFDSNQLKSIEFKGMVSNDRLLEVYSNATICVFPSHMETQGLVALEAMACGKAVVFTELGPGPETVQNFETGILCDPHSPNDIAEKIIWAFENRNSIKEIGFNARKRVFEFYNVSKIIDDNLKFYKSIC
jgi:glycosyltransferase involved in cell wall biosynthesis